MSKEHTPEDNLYTTTRVREHLASFAIIGVSVREDVANLIVQSERIEKEVAELKAKYDKQLKENEKLVWIIHKHLFNP